MKKILLAEHNAFLINLYAKELRESGYEISVALDAQMAVSRAKEINFDLLILDAALPKMEEFNLLKTLREDLGLSDLKVVMLSNFSQEEKIKNSQDLCAIKYFLKTENTAKDIAEGVKHLLS
jgi:DNA-binding response OmpR family regulator